MLLNLLLPALLLCPQEPEGQPIRPTEWLLIDEVDGRGRRPFRPDAVFERYLLDPGRAPAAGEEVSGSQGRAAWRPFTADGRVPAQGRGAYAYAAVEVEEAGVYLAELRGATTLMVNGAATAGDVYRYGFEGYPIALRAGLNDLFVTGARGGFDLSLVPVEEGLSVAPRDRMVPDLVEGRMQGPVGVLVRNASPSATSYGGLVASSDEQRATLPRQGRALQPLCVERELLDLSALPAAALEAGLEVAPLPAGRPTSLGFATRPPGERHRRTYRSEVDGSVQEYVVNPPSGVHEGPMRLALSLHGAGVGAWGQASSYAPKPDFWVVAATNRRTFGFDWQDWGRRDAYDVLREAQRLSGVDDRRLYVTGHSMGGHGTWHLAANDPDTFAACGPSAGWPTFDTYGGRPEQRDLWLRADGASLTLDLVDNVKQVAPFVIHGTADRNVPPGQALTMLEALTAANATVEVHLQGGAGHWWGSRCVDWPPLFEHFRAHERDPDPVALEFVTVDPGVDSRHHWVSVLQPLEYGRPSRVQARLGEEGLVVTTSNVRALRVHRRVDRATLDGEELAPQLEAPGEDPSAAASVEAGSWTAIRGDTGWSLGAPGPLEKSPRSSGPFKRAFDEGFLLVIGTQGDDARDAALLARARHDSTVWTYRANGDAPVVTDQDYLRLAPSGNVILYGNRDDNAAWVVLGEEPEVDFEDGAARVGGQRFEGDLAGVFVQQGRTAQGPLLVGAFASTSTRAARVGDTFAPFISGVGYPDYAVVGLDVLARGDEGVVAAGWFDHAWRLPD